MSTRVLVAASTYSGEDADYWCDGIDDQVEINAAIQYVALAHGGGIVELTAGTFNLEALEHSTTFDLNEYGAAIAILWDNVELVGQGRATLLHIDDSPGFSQVLVSGAGSSGSVSSYISGNRVADLRVEGIDSGVGFGSIMVGWAKKVVVENVWAEDVRGGITVFDAPDIRIQGVIVDNPTGWGIRFYLSQAEGNTFISNVAVRDSGDVGILVDSGASDGEILNSIVENATGEGIEVRGDGFSITGNTVRNSDEGIEISGDNNFISGNHVEGSTTADYVDSGTDTRFGSNYFQGPYDTGWINRSDWNNEHLGSSTTKNDDSDVDHNLDADLSKLLVRVLISTDGTDNNSFEVQVSSLDNSSLPGGNQDYGVTVFQIDTNSLRVQTGQEGVLFVRDSDGQTSVENTDDDYYKIVVWRYRA